MKSFTMNDFMHLSKVLNEGEDSSVILMSGSLLESILEMSILNHVIDSEKSTLKDFKATCINDFERRILFAYMVGLITKEEFHDLDIVRKVRNVVAHEYLHITFETESVKNRVLTLTKTEHNTYSSELSVREIYIASTVSLFSTIGMRNKGRFSNSDLKSHDGHEALINIAGKVISEGLRKSSAPSAIDQQGKS